MDYKKVKSHQLSEQELRDIWKTEYCNQQIFTFDGVRVHFYEDMFNHCFYESADRLAKDKSILSLNRLEKILWIKATLQDPDAVLKFGWDKDKNIHYTDRRVAIVKGNYMVVIRFTGVLKAKFVTAYQKEDIENVLQGPDFVKPIEYFPEEEKKKNVD